MGWSIGDKQEEKVMNTVCEQKEKVMNTVCEQKEKVMNTVCDHSAVLPKVTFVNY